MGFSKEEQESTLVYEAETNEWKGYSCYPPHITKIIKILGIENVKADYEEGRESPVSIVFRMKPNQVSFRQGKEREMTEEQREKARKRALKMQEARKRNNS